MPKIFEGVVVSLKMQKTAVIETVRTTPHPIYKKIIKRNRKIKADTAGYSFSLGDRVKIIETKPISKQKHFKILEVLKR